MGAGQARRAESNPQTAAETQRPTFHEEAEREAEEQDASGITPCEACGCDCMKRAARRAEKGKATEELEEA